jgi:putative ABC transport system substrate-binding protein
MGHVRRRQFLTATSALLTASYSFAQQPPRRVRIGVLHVRSQLSLEGANEAIIDGLRNRGYVLGQNLIVDFRYGDGTDQLSVFADELIALKPDVLVGGQITARVMKGKTSSIPIVLMWSADPVSGGLVKSLARPGTNVTGMSASLYTILAKQMELLVEIVPRISRVAVLAGPLPAKGEPTFGQPEPWELSARQAADAKGLSLVLVRAGDRESLRNACAEIRSQRAQALVVATHGWVIRMHDDVMDEVRKLRIPAASGYDRFAENGGIAAYTINWEATARYAMKFVDRILRGAMPADLPVEQVDSFELVVNQMTARELGLKIPPSVLIRANRVIE